MTNPSGISNPNKALSGTAKNLLDDLLELNRKTSEEMARGIREGYLDPDGAVVLAEQLAVTPPRVRRNFRIYFTTTQVHFFTVEAYDQEQALREGERLMSSNATAGELVLGSRGRTAGPVEHRHVFSTVQTERPTVQQIMDSLSNPHPLQQEVVHLVTGGMDQVRARRTVEQRVPVRSVIDTEEQERLAGELAAEQRPVGS